MDDVSELESVYYAREALGISETSTYHTWRVHRLDRKEGDYYLVQLYMGETKSALAVVDIRSGAVNITAQLSSSRTHIAVDIQMAKRLAGADELSQAKLVWMPSPASKSPLYPFWQITMPDGVVRYVDQQKNVLTSLQTDRLGG
jgi:hypothetical protein